MSDGGAKFPALDTGLIKLDFVTLRARKADPLNAFLKGVTVPLSLLERFEADLDDCGPEYFVTLIDAEKSFEKRDPIFVASLSF